MRAWALLCACLASDEGLAAEGARARAAGEAETQAELAAEGRLHRARGEPETPKELAAEGAEAGDDATVEELAAEGAVAAAKGDQETDKELAAQGQLHEEAGEAETEAELAAEGRLAEKDGLEPTTEELAAQAAEASKRGETPTDEQLAAAGKLRREAGEGETTAELAAEARLHRANGEPVSAEELAAEDREQAQQTPAPTPDRLAAARQLCDGEVVEAEQCMEEECHTDCDPVNAEWALWGAWGVCECSGVRQRHRPVMQHATCGGDFISGPQVEGEACEPDEKTCGKPLPEPCVFSEWAPWSACECGTLQVFRHRVIEQFTVACEATCEGPLQETLPCDQKRLAGCVLEEQRVNCAWEPWTPWSQCSKSCGGGQRLRERAIRPATAALDRRLAAAARLAPQAADASLQAKGANPAPLPREPQLAELHEEAEAPLQPRYPGAGAGSRAAETPGGKGGPKFPTLEEQTAEWGEIPLQPEPRPLQPHRPVAAWHIVEERGEPCDGPLAEVQPCNEQCCAKDDKRVDCVWGAWSAWGACSAQCGGGSRARQRQVATWNREGGEPCPPSATVESEQCNMHRCGVKKLPVDGEWSPWTEWGECTTPCGGGYRMRSRHIQREAKYGGRPVLGQFQDFMPCYGKPCYVKEADCELASWGEWSACSMKCNGLSTRHRNIAVHAANAKPCSAPLSEVRACNVGRPTDDNTTETEGGCPVHNELPCAWSQWTAWSQCTKSCLGGAHMRTRHLHVGPGFAPACDGPTEEVESCNEQQCWLHATAEDCEWRPWTEWDPCPVSCGGGESSRTRSVERLARMGGDACDAGSSVEVRACNAHTCDTEHFCAWTAWELWGECSQTCGEGQRFRAKRLHLTAHPQHGYLATTALSELEEEAQDLREVLHWQLTGLALAVCGLAALVAVVRRKDRITRVAVAAGSFE